MATKDIPETNNVVTTDQTGATVAPASPAQLYPGLTPPAAQAAAPTAGNDAFQPVPGNDPDLPNETNLQRMGVGVEGETTGWEGRYALKNFVGRFLGAILLTIGWAVLAIYAWGYQRTSLQIPAGLTGAILALIWLALLRRVVLARYGHFYRLTNRRLFVSTGVFRRRRDQMELLRVQDVYTRQSIWDRMLSLGTVVVVSQEAQLPVTYLAGVDDPKGVMDLVWHHARAERDRRSVKVDQV